MPNETGAVTIQPELVEQEPLSIRMLKAITQYLPKRPVGLDVVGADVQYGAYLVEGNLMSGYALLITVKGAFIGPQYHITNAHIIAPYIPSRSEAEEMIHVSTARLREAKMGQVRQAMGGNSG